MNGLKSKLAAAALLGVMAASAQAVVVIYEPFDYAAGALNGKSGATEIGLTGTWSNTNLTSNVVASSLSYGALPTTGGSIGNLGGSINRFGGSRAVSAAALAGNGLLNDGAELWFSVEMGYGTGGNVTNSRLAFALANSSFSAANFNYNINNEGAQLGEGLGVTLGRFDGVNGRVAATEFRDGTTGSGFAGNVFGTVANLGYTGGVHGLLVGRIVWGALSDTIEIFAPNLALQQGPVISTLTTDVNQAAFDTITFARGDIVVMDEIRFGTSFNDVIGVLAAPAVPEPATAALGLMGLGGLLMRRRRIA